MVTKHREDLGSSQTWYTLQWAQEVVPELPVLFLFSTVRDIANKEDGGDRITFGFADLLDFFQQRL